MKKPFDLEYYLEHPETKVITREGKSVRIICTDHKNEHYPIVAEYDNDGYGNYDLRTYTTEGKFNVDVVDKSVLDLFFDIPDPVKKKVPLTYDDLLERVKKGKTMWFLKIADIAYNIVDFDNDSLYYIHADTRRVHNVSYNDIVDDFKFADGDPCWKEVEE